METDKIATRTISGWRTVGYRNGEAAPCVGCNGRPKANNRTCGERKCIAIALCLSGLLPSPTVQALNDWYKASLAKQIDEMSDDRHGHQTSLRKRLIKQFFEMR